MANFEYIKHIVEGLKVKYNLNDSDLYKNGAVFYMNGNDGTDFDWDANDKVCEFVVFYKESEMGALKLDFYKNDTVSYYFFKDGEWNATETGEMDAPCSVARLACYLYGTFDKKDRWDEEITDWNFRDSETIPFEEDEEEYNYDYDYDYEEDEEE